jgi:hypothetical protein
MQLSKFFRRATLFGMVGLSLMMVAAPLALAASSTPEDKKSLSDYIAKVDPVCETARVGMARTVASFERHKANTANLRGSKVNIAKPKELAQYVKVNLHFLEEQQVAIKKVKLPTGPYQAQLTDLWKRTDAVIAAVKKDPAEAAYTDPFRPMAQALRGLGFSSCLQPRRPKTD